MERLAKGFVKLICTVLCAGLFFGCGKTEDGGKETDNREANNVIPENNQEGKTLWQDEAEKEDGNDSKDNHPEDEKDPSGDKTDAKGGMADPDEKTPEKDGSVLTEVTNTPVPEVKFELLKNYKEKNIPSVYGQGEEKEHYCNVLLNSENQIEYYTYSKDKDGRHFYKYTLIEEAGGDGDFLESPYWEREELFWCEGFGKEIGEGGDWVKILTGEDGNDYAWYLGTDNNAHLVKRVEGLSGEAGTDTGNGEKDHYKEIAGLDWTYTNFIEPGVLENGNIICADLGRQCSIYNPEDGSLIKRFQCGFYQSICIEGDQVYIGDLTGSSVQHYDAGKQEFAATLEAGFDTTIRTAVSGDDVYVCNKNGIYRARKDGGSFTKVLEAGTYHFANDSAVLLKFFVMGDAFYVVYGEDGASIKKYYPAGEDEAADKTINIYSLKTNEVILDMISEFQNMYPDTEIVYETGEGAEGSITTADRIRALNARLLSGDGPDILLMDGLSSDSYISKGILADLSPMLGELKEKLTTNILSNYIEDGQIYMLPARFTVPMILTVEQDKEKYSTLKALVEYSEAEGGVMIPSYLYSNVFEMLFYNYPPELILEDNTVNREGILEFLEQLKRLCKSEEAVESGKWPATYLGGLNPSMYFAMEINNFAFVNLTSQYALGTYPSAIEMRGGQLLPCGGRFFPNTLIAVNALSGKTGLAKKFVQFVFSYEIQKRSVGLTGYPLHSDVLDECAKLDMSDFCLASGDIVLQDAGAEENGKMIEYVRKVDTPFMVDANIYDIMLGEAMGYLTDKYSLSESVDAAASKIQLYLYEQ